MFFSPFPNQAVKRLILNTHLSPPGRTKELAGQRGCSARSHLGTWAFHAGQGNCKKQHRGPTRATQQKPAILQKTCWRSASIHQLAQLPWVVGIAVWEPGLKLLLLG